MPMITAANAPYNPVPTQGPSPTTGTDFQNIAGATPEAFGYGIGQAESRVGAVGEEAGNRLAERAIAQQQLLNNTAANNSVNWFGDEANKILHGDPNKPGDVGFYGLKGLDAVNARQGAMQSIDNLMQSARGQLTNPRQILEFDRESRRQRNFMANDIGRHYDQQLTQSAINSATAGMNLAGQGMSVAAANQDWVAFNNKVEDYMKSAMDHNKAVGGTQVMLDEQLQKARGIATRQWVEGLVEKNPTQARDFLEANKDALLPNELKQLQGMVRKGADNAEINRWVNGPPRGGLVQGGKANMVSNAVNANIPPEGRALLDTIAGPESHGAYNARWPGTTFSGFADHPRIAEPGPEGPSTAAGRYQLVASTWDPLAERLGLTDFRPENQDAAAWQLAQDAFKQQKGGDLLTALKEGKLTEVQSALRTSRQWDTANMNLFAANLQKYQGTQPALTQVSQVGEPPDVLLNNRPLPIREPNEIPDAEIPGTYFPDGRGGGMSLTQKLQQLARDMPNENEHDAAMFASAVKAVRAQANGQYADQQHAHRMQQEADKANDQALMTQYQQRMTSNNANYPTVDEVLGDKRWKDPAAQRQIVGFIERQEKQDPAAANSKINTNDLYTKMNLPEGTSERINNENAINNSYIAGDITRQDHDWLVKQFRDSRSAGGETFAKLRAEFIRMVAEPQIKGADPQYDNLWGDRLFQYQSKLDNDIKRYEDTGKNKFDLFDPAKPDYAGRDDFIGWYRSKMFSSFKDAPDASLPIAPIDLGSPDKVKAAYESHKVTWDQASDALQKLGHPLRQAAPQGPQVPMR